LKGRVVSVDVKHHEKKKRKKGTESNCTIAGIETERVNFFLAAAAAAHSVTPGDGRLELAPFRAQLEMKHLNYLLLLECIITSRDLVCSLN